MGILTFLSGCITGDGAPDNVAKAPHQFKARTVAFAPDGAVVVTNGSGDWNFCELPSGAVQKTIVGAGGSPGNAKFSADGRFLGAASHDTVRMWRVADGTKLLDVAVPDSRSQMYSPRFNHVAVSPDGTHVAASDVIGNDLYVWRVMDGKLLAKRDDEPFRVLGWMSDGVLSSGALFRVENEHLKALTSFNHSLYNLQPWQVCASNDGELFALESVEGFDILNLKNGTRHALEFPHRSVTDVRFSPDKTVIALRFQTGDSVRGPHIRSFVEVRRVADGALLHFMQVGTSKDGTDTLGTDMNISGDNKWLVIESRAGTLHLWDMSGWTTPIPQPPSPHDEGRREG